MARLLEPMVFGLMGMLALFIGLAQVFADSGFSASLIQRKTITADDETSVCAINIAAGVVLAALLCLISPFVARFYKQPVLMPLLCVLSLSIIISSFCIVQAALLARAMAFHKTALVSTSGTIAGSIAGIVMAYLGYGVWSLAGAVLCAGFVKLAIYWAVSDWRPKGKVRLVCVRSMWNFSSNVLYCSLMGIAYQNMYSVLIGKVYSPASLGYYDRANSLRLLPASTITGIVNRVAFPLFSRCQDDKLLLLKRMRELVRSTLLLSAGGLTLLAIVADPLIPIILTEKWRPVIPLLRILCYAGVLYPINALYLMVLQAQGYSNLIFRLESIKVINGIVAVVLIYRYGVIALAWSVVGLAFIAYFINVWYTVKLLGYQWRFQAFDILPTFALCAIAACFTLWISAIVGLIPIAVLFIQTGTLILFLVFGCFMFRKIYFFDAWKHLVWAYSWFRQRAVLA